MIQLVVRAVIQHSGKYLLVRHKDASHWCLPGGRVEPGEQIEQALERELVEELGVRPLLGQVLYVQQLFLGDGTQRVEFFFLVNNPEEYDSVDISKTTHGFELDEAAFQSLGSVDLLPKFLAVELPALLKNYTSGTLPHFRMSKQAPRV